MKEVSSAFNNSDISIDLSHKDVDITYSNQNCSPAKEVEQKQVSSDGDFKGMKLNQSIPNNLGNNNRSIQLISSESIDALSASDGFSSNFNKVINNQNFSDHSCSQKNPKIIYKFKKQNNLKSSSPKQDNKSQQNMIKNQDQRQDSQNENNYLGNFLFNQLNQKSLLCKIQKNKKTNRKISRQSLQAQGQKKRFSGLYRNQNDKIEMKVLKISETFFTEFPHFELMKHNYINFKNKNYSKSKIGDKDNQNSLSQVNFRHASQSHNQNISAQSQQIDRVSLSNLINNEQGSEQEQSQNLNLLNEFQKELLELRIYQPYLISHSTIMEYEDYYDNPKSQQERYSILDILEQHQSSGKQINRLFFKVNSNQDIYNQWNQCSQMIPSQIIKDNKMQSLSLQNQNSKQNIISKSSPIIEQENDKKRNSSSNLEFERKSQMEKEQNNQVKAERKNIIKRISGLRNEKSVQIQQESENSVIQEDSQEDQNYSLVNNEIINNISYQVILDGSFDQLDQIDQSENHDFQRQGSQILSDHNISRYYSDKINRIENIKEPLQEQLKYYEFEIKQIKQIQEGGDYPSDLTLLNIKDVTQIVINQMKLSDIIYQDAIENNFSHEQMTPLNLLKANSHSIQQQFYNLYQKSLEQQKEIFNLKQKNNQNDMVNLQQEIQKSQNDAKVTLKMLHGSEQAAQSLWFFNQSQIQRMKISKKQFKIKETTCKDIQKIIEKVFWPFQSQTFSKQINVYFVKGNDFDFEMISDWPNYQLILFSMVQNSVKYNIYQGDVIVVVTCKPIKQNDAQQQNFILKRSTNSKRKECMLETVIIDSGIGISPERQEYLFIPFLELKCMQGLMKKPQNDNIGLGLASSKDITLEMKGDIKLEQSQRGLTVFKFKIPVTAVYNMSVIRNESIRLSQNSIINQKRQMKCIQIHGEPRKINQNIQNYFDMKGQKILHEASINQSQSIEGNISNISPSNDQQLRKSKFTEQIRFPNQNNDFGIDFDKGQRKSFEQQLQNQNFISLKKNKQIFQMKSFQEADMLQQFPLKKLKKLQQQSQDIKFNKQSFVKELSISLASQNVSSFHQSSIQQNNIQLINQNGIDFKDLIQDLNFAQDINQEENKQEEEQQILPAQQSQNQSSFFNEMQLDSGQNQDIIVLNQDNQEERKNEQEGNLIREDIQQQNAQAVQIIEHNQNMLHSLSKHKVCLGALMVNHRDINFQEYYEKENECMNQDQISHSSEESEDSTIQNQIQIGLDEPNRQFHIMNIDDIFGEQNMFFIRNINVDSSSKRNQLVFANEQPIMMHNQRSIKSQLSQQEESKQDQINLQNINVLEQYLENAIKQNLDRDSVQISNKSIRSERPSNSESICQNINGQQQRSSFLQGKVDSQNQISNIANQSQVQKIPNQINSIAQIRSSQKSSSLKKSIYQRQSFSSQLDILEEEKEESINNNNVKQDKDQNIQIISNYQEINNQIQNDINIQQFDIYKLKKNSLQCLNLIQNNQDFQQIQLQKRSSVEIKPIKITSNKYDKFSKLFNIKKKEEQKEEHKDQQCECKPSALFVDDTMFNLMAAKLIFSRTYHYQVDEATSGQMAIDLVKKTLIKECNCRNRTYKIIFMDIQMPEMDGTEATEIILKLMSQDKEKYKERMKTEEGYHEIKCNVLALSAYSGDKNKQNAKKSGMVDYMNKPLTKKDLILYMDKYFIPLIQQSEILPLKKDENNEQEQN